MFSRIFSQLFLGLIAIYQWVLSPLRFLIHGSFESSCRFYPSCSEYGKKSIIAHGPWKGFLLTSSRICRCNPLNDGGIDMVPEEFSIRRLLKSTLEEKTKSRLKNG